MNAVKLNLTTGMKTKALRLGVAVFISATLITFTSCSKKDTEKKDTEKKSVTKDSGTGALVATTTTTTATVMAVDPAKRTVTLKDQDGKTRTYAAGRNMVNFDRIKVGDKVNATLVDSIAIAVRKAGAPPNVGERTTVALAPQGAQPGALMVDTIEATAKIQAVDTKDRTITLEGMAGKPRTMKVGPNVNLGNFKNGDDVTVRFTQALAIRVEPPSQK